MIAAQIAVQVAGALDRAAGALVEGHLALQAARGHQPVEVAAGVFQALQIAVDLVIDAVERLVQTRDVEVAAQAAGGDEPAQKAAAGESAVDLLHPLFQQMAFGLTDLERGGLGQMAEVMQMVVQTLQLGQDDAQIAGARRWAPAHGALHSLGKCQRMRHRVDTAHALGQHRARRQRGAFKAPFHRPVLVEQPRVIVQDAFADVEKQKLRRLDDVGPHRAERQTLDVRPLHLRHDGRQRRIVSCRGCGVEARCQGRRIARLALVQNQWVRLGMTFEAQAV